MLSRLCYRSRGSFGLRACSPPCPNSPRLANRFSCPSPLPPGSSFVVGPPTRGGWAAQRFPTLASQQHNQRPTTLAHQSKSTWRGRARPGPRDGVYTHKSENHTRGPRTGVCTSEAKKRARGPRTIERSEIVWGGLWGGSPGVPAMEFVPTKLRATPGAPRSCSILLCQDGTHCGSERTSPGVPGLSSAARKSGVGLWGWISPPK